MRQPRLRRRAARHIVRVVIFIALIITVAFFVIRWLMPSSVESGWRAYFSCTQNRPYIIDRDELVTEESARLIDGKLYIGATFAKEHIDDKLFWEQPSGTITITDYATVRRLRVGSNVQTINRQESPLIAPIISSGNNAWLPAEFLEDLYGYTIRYYEATGLVVVDNNVERRERASIGAQKAALRALANPKSPILGYAQKGEIVAVYGEKEGYYRVRLYDGRTGYIAKQKVKKAEPSAPAPAKPAPPAFNVGLGRRVTIMWDQFFSADSAANTQTRYIGGNISVLSPTWFSFSADYGGGLEDWADRSYVDWAHENGAAVWALITDNFDEGVAANVLSDTNKREKVIDQLLDFASIYGFDGINIDFEMVRLADAAYYTQFLRELAPLAHAAGLAVSVDMYVPKPYNMYYNRAAVAEVCDYIIIMGYDEHYKGDSVEGPVASIGFVEDGISETLKEAPAAKVILGVPLYNRVWTRTFTPVGDKLTATDYGMSAPKEDFAEHGAGFIWDEATKTHYGEYDGVDDDGNIYKRMVWLEDETALAEKLSLAETYELVGVAGWKRRLETENVWDMFEKWRTGN